LPLDNHLTICYSIFDISSGGKQSKNNMDNTKALTVKKERKISLQQLVDQETKSRAILTKFITDHMKDGVDFGRIHFSKLCPNKYECTYAKQPSHFSKPSLFKPGAEKFASLMHLRPTYKKDEDTWVMGGSVPGTFYYVCYLMKENGDIAGEGRGAASIEEKGSPNVAVKLAQKRAKVDAVLSTGGLSDFFTQDLEDMPDLDKTKMVASSTTPTQQVPIALATEAQVKFAKNLLKQKGKEEKAVLDHRKISSLNELTKLQASMLIEQLMKFPNLSDFEQDMAGADEAHVSPVTTG
jgi:hypothetical protein